MSIFLLRIALHYCGLASPDPRYPKQTKKHRNAGAAATLSLFTGDDVFEQELEGAGQRARVSRHDMSTTALPGAEHHTLRRAAKSVEEDPFFDSASLTLGIDPVNARLVSGNKRPTGSNLLLDLFWTPLSMIGFLLSLQWVDHRQGQSHLLPSSLAWSRFMRWATFVEPQQLPEDSTWTTTTDKDGARVLANAHDIRPKHKSRRVAKMEISDALAMRGRVLLALAAWIVLAIVLLVLGSYHLYTWVVR